MNEKKEIITVTVEEFVFEQLEDRVVPSVTCVTSSSSTCSSTSCIVLT